ncbi:MAG: 50S ribosomal protein L23 [Candidatus Wolfebacteria bacterium]|nr:50S ribosomal protein L23 [Candidatus Wolfebacteria bacterium]MDP2704704.1 50S ribosomal protein L23 [bacterium]
MALFKKTVKTTPEAKLAGGGKKTTKEKPEESGKTRRSAAGEKRSVYFVKKPWISEKATILGEKNVYVFDVRPSANKKTVKEEVESRYNVRVRNVRTIRYSGKMKKFKNTTKRRSGFKKAIVTVKEGDKIDIL